VPAARERAPTLDGCAAGRRVVGDNPAVQRNDQPQPPARTAGSAGKAPPRASEEPLNRLRTDPLGWLPVGLAIAVTGALLWFIGADPTSGVTASGSPFTDEAWNVVNARNLVLLGTWSTDQFNLHLVNGPFSILEAGVFSILGVGIVQARLLSIASVGVTTVLLGFGLRQPLGRGPAVVGAAAFGTCLLVLFYGRLAYTETLVMLEMTAGAVLIGRTAGDGPAGRWGLLAGVFFGLAIATKALAGFGVAGAILALLVVESRRSTATRRWLAGCVGGVLAIGLAWIVIVFIPDHAAVAIDLNIWAHQVTPTSIAELLGRVVSYPFRSDGALPGLAPIAVGAIVGVVATVAGWRQMPPTRRRLAVAAIGWVAVHLAVLLVSSYRPNRYLLPMLPGAILLVAVGAATVGESLRRRAVPRSLSAGAIAAGLAVVMLPGMVSYGRWMSHATNRLEPMQRAVATLIPPGSTVWGGYAPLVAMGARVTTIVPWPPASANNGPAYQSRPVRWIVTGNHEPEWIVPSSPAWAARVERLCFRWDRQRVCLVELP